MLARRRLVRLEDGQRAIGRKAQVAQVAALADAGNYADAYDLRRRGGTLPAGRPDDHAADAAISDSISATTEPAGATVYLKRFTAGAALRPRQLLGTSPLTNARIARGEYVLSIEKDGYAPIERTVSGVTIRPSALVITPPPIRIEQRLHAGDACPRAWCSCRVATTGWWRGHVRPTGACGWTTTSSTSTR